MITRCRAEPFSLVAKAVVLFVALVAGCDGEIIEPEPNDGPSGPAGPNIILHAPTRIDFEKVADALQVSCGTLDCHGQIGRNLRLFGKHGLRLDENASPADGRTTAAEYEATYWSIIGLEPEMLSTVVAEDGKQPLRLSLIRKAAGVERHKGGRLTVLSEELDRCLYSWLESRMDITSCEAVADTSRPEPAGL